MSSTGQILTLRLDEIRVPEARFRALKVEQARAIGAAIAADGQYDAIAVTKLPGQEGYVLVDGWHRLEGSRLSGLPTIEAREIAINVPTRVKREALSGMVRASHDVLDRAAAVDALIRQAREDAGLPVEGDLRSARGIHAIQQAADVDFPIMGKWLRWDEQVAAQLGCGRENIRRLKVIHERIPAEIKARLRDRSQADKLVLLTKFAALLPDEMAKVMLVLEDQEEPDLAAAMAQFDPSERNTPAENIQNTFFRKAEDWSPRERASFLHMWRKAYFDDGRKRAGSERADG